MDASQLPRRDWARDYLDKLHHCAMREVLESLLPNTGLARDVIHSEHSFDALVDAEHLGLVTSSISPDGQTWTITESGKDWLAENGDPK